MSGAPPAENIGASSGLMTLCVFALDAEVAPPLPRTLMAAASPSPGARLGTAVPDVLVAPDAALARLAAWLAAGEEAGGGIFSAGACAEATSGVDTAFSGMSAGLAK